MKLCCINLLQSANLSFTPTVTDMLTNKRKKDFTNSDSVNGKLTG